VDIRQAKVPAGVAIDELFVVESQEVQHCRMPVVDLP